MNYRQPSTVDTIIWLAAAIVAAFAAIGLTLLMAFIGAAMLLARMAGEAARSVFRALFGGGVNHKQRSREEGVRPTVVEGQVLSHN